MCAAIMERKRDPELKSLDLCLENQMLFIVQNLTGNLITKDLGVWGGVCLSLSQFPVR